MLARISEETREAIIEAKRNGVPFETPPYTNTPRSPTWSDPAENERREELDRERSLQNDITRIESDSRDSVRPPSGKITESIKQGTTDTWDKLRHGSSPLPTPRGLGTSTPTVDQDKDDGRSLEQREFDALLEKERQGIDVNDRWK